MMKRNVADTTPTLVDTALFCSTLAKFAAALLAVMPPQTMEFKIDLCTDNDVYAVKGIDKFESM
jgi:hypothetical protein